MDKTIKLSPLNEVSRTRGSPRKESRVVDSQFNPVGKPHMRLTPLSSIKPASPKRSSPKRSSPKRSSPRPASPKRSSPRPASPKR